jgi:hypothetical protein
VVPARAGRVRPGPAGRPLRLARGRPRTGLGRVGPRHPGLGPLPRPAPGLVPQELLRPAAGPELRLDQHRPRPAVARRRRRARPAAQPRGAAGDPGLLAVEGGRRLPGGHGLLAGQGRPVPRRGGGVDAGLARAAGLDGRGAPRRRPRPRGHRAPGRGPAARLLRRLRPRDPRGARQPVRQPRRGRAALPRPARAVLRRRRTRQHPHLPRRLGAGTGRRPGPAGPAGDGGPRLQPALLRDRALASSSARRWSSC